jgi:SAM-dependent methyltransferase
VAEPLRSAEYFCRIHGRRLIEVNEEGWCEDCPHTYPVQEGIWMLDTVNRPDQRAFDEQVAANPVPFDSGKAAKLLAAANAKPLRNSRILDVGCGLGDLTHGLAESPMVTDSDIYAFDHSVESLRRAASVTSKRNGNRVHFSAQDAQQLFFADRSFDLVAGSAVLHHFLDYGGFLREAARILKPGATAVFAEPFLDGYFWPTLFLKYAIESCGLDSKSPEFASATTIGHMEFTCRNRGNNPALEHLTDKHCFRENDLTAAAHAAGFDLVRFAPFELPEYYKDWMPLFLDIYGVTHPEVRRVAIAQYESAAALAGPLLPDLMAHFKYIVLRKALWD